METWKSIKNYENLYEISAFGEVRAKNGRFKKCRRNKKGYLIVDLYSKGVRKTHTVHRIVANSFIPNPTSLPQVNHIDGDKENNLYSNLEWCDSRKNNIHAFSLGLRVPMKGSRNGRSKLTEVDVLLIRESYMKLGHTRKFLSNKFKVSYGTICDILNYKTWSHI